jgi:hypothetical protein
MQKIFEIVEHLFLIEIILKLNFEILSNLLFKIKCYHFIYYCKNTCAYLRLKQSWGHLYLKQSSVFKGHLFMSCLCHRKFIWIELLLRGHLSYKTTLALSQRWPLNTGLTETYTWIMKKVELAC